MTYQTGILAKENIMEYLPLVKKVVSRIFPSIPPQLLDFEDLIGYGMIGLMESLDTYNPDKGVKFSTYAFYRIRGAILDALRSLDWMPREMRRKIHSVEAAVNTLTAELGRDPDEEEIAKKTGLSETEVSSLLIDSYQSEVLSFENNLHYYLVKRTDNFLDLDELEKTDLGGIISEAIDVLPEREKTILTLYYFEEMNLKEIGRVFDLSESRVSQILKKILIGLREKLKAVGGEL